MEPKHPLRHRYYLTRKDIMHGELHPIGYDPARERLTVRVQPAAFESNQHVSVTHTMRAENRVLIDVSDDEAGEIVIRRRVHTGHFRRLAAHERRAVFAPSSGDSGHDRLDDFPIQPP